MLEFKSITQEDLLKQIVKLVRYEAWAVTAVPAKTKAKRAEAAAAARWLGIIADKLDEAVILRAETKAAEITP